MAAFLSVLGPGRRPEPHLVVKPIRNGLDRLWFDPINGWLRGRLESRTNPDLHLLQLAYSIISHKLAPKPKVRSGSLPTPGLPNAAVSIHLIDKNTPLGHRQRQRLLTVNILARPNTFQSDNPMPVVRHRNAQGIDIAAPDQLAKIVVLCTVRVAVVLVNLFNRRPPSGSVNIAHRNNPAIVLLKKSFNMTHAHASQPDKAHRQASARRGFAQNRSRHDVGRGNRRNGTA